MSGAANRMRGEVVLCVGDRDILLRPSFAALVAAEDELGPLFALVERAAAGQLKLAEIVALFWHCRTDDEIDRDRFSDGVVMQGIAACTPALRTLLEQILAGQ